MTTRDYHAHTTFCDGRDSIEDMAAAACAMGLAEFGLSGHCYTAFDERYCMSREDVKAYRRAIGELKGRYEGEMRLLCGIEQDLHGADPAEGFDYVIGSVHYIKIRGEYIPVDETPEILMDAVRERFGGDVYGFAEAYFDSVAQVAEATGCHIIGHFDLVSKFNEGDRLFDSGHPRYAAAWQKAADWLLRADIPFEINTGAISRGYRSWAYPARQMMEYIRDKGGRFILNSDSHSAANICYQFPIWQARAEELGLRLASLFE